MNVGSNFYRHLLMTKMLKNFIISIYCLTFLISCGSTARLYRPDNTNRIYSGRLDDASNTSLRQFLASRATSSLKDTIIIKYDYNNESCWELLDQKDDNYMQGFVTRHKERVQKVQATRPNVSLFDFREPGDNVNMIKKWDGTIIIDSSRQLMNLLFKERSICGNSIIVMPDKRFVFIRSDSHSEAMDLTQNRILEHLTKN
jgi:hypothetical protein